MFVKWLRIWILLFALLAAFSSCGKSSHKNPGVLPALPAGNAGFGEVSRLDDYGFGTGGFVPEMDYYPDRFVVGFKDSAKGTSDSPTPIDYNPNSKLYRNAGLASLAREIRDCYDVTLNREAYVRGVNFASYQTKDGSCAKEIMEQIQADYSDAIEYIEYDGIRYLQYVPNDPDYPANLWGMVKINAEDAWDTETGDSNIMVCVIDTGVRYSGDTVGDAPDHEDLADNYLHPPDYWPDEIFDIYDEDNVPEDGHGHGSHVSGTIGAVGDNSTGVVGVNHDITMVQIRVFGPSGGCPDSWVATAVELATEIESDVISMSLAGSFPNLATKEACEDAYDAGIFIASAAANSYTDEPYYPGYYEVCCCVGATNSSDDKANFSNYGQWVDIAAPGVSVKSCGYVSTSAYMKWGGTSMATPHVAGAAALLLSYDNTLTVDELRSALESTGADLTDSQWGNPDIKRLDVDAALDYVIGDEFGAPPTVSIDSPDGTSSVSGTVTIEASASDSDGSILKVFFYADGVQLGTDDSDPYTCEWDTTKYLNKAYTLKAEALDNQHMTTEDTVSVTVSNTVETPNYFIDFESGSTGWWHTDENGSGYWQLVDNDGASGIHSFHQGGASGANYGNLEFDRLYSPVLDLSGLEAVRLKFKHHYAFASNDHGYIIINDGTYDFIFLDDFAPGTLSSWTQETYSLDDYIGDSIQVVFLFESARDYTYAAGWWIDDFTIEKKTAPCSIDITSPAADAEVNETVSFAASVTDDIDVTLVEMYIGDSLKADFTDDGPYEYSWITTDYHGGTHSLKVYAEDEWPTSSEKSINVTVKNHTVTGADVTSGIAGTTVTIGGTYFIADSGDAYNASTDKVYFSGASGWSEAAVNDWQKEAIEVTVPDGAVTGPLKVDINGAEVTSGFDFTMLPHIDALNPAIQIVGGDITIEGTGFGASANEDSVVDIGGLEATVVSWETNAIEVTIPSEVIQSDLTVTVTSSTSNAVVFTPKPNITGLDPNRTWPGNEITITGTSFGDEQGDSTVTFAGPVEAAPEDIVSWSETEIVVVLPENSLRGDVAVTVNDVDSDGEFLIVILPPPSLGGVQQY